MSIRIMITALAWLLLAAGPALSADDLDRVLQGFGPDAPARPAAGPEPGGLDSVLGGFDAPPPDQPKDQGLDHGLDQVLEGFTDSSTPPAGPLDARAGREDPMLPGGRALRADISGSLTLAGALNFAHDPPRDGATDHRGLSKLRPELDAELDLSWGSNWKARVAGHAFYDLVYDLKPGADYTQAQKDAYRDELELGEAWIQGELIEDLDIKIGRQIVVWGKSDNIRVTDVLNPLDNRDPGLTDIEDLRLPVFMAKADYYFGPWCLSGIALPEIRFNKDPAFGSDFYPLDTPPPPREHPDSFTLPDTEWALALSGVFSGWDLALYWARIYNDAFYLAPLPYGGLERRHARVTMAGVSANLALGNWLLKSEAAFLDGLRFFADPGADYRRLDVLAGVEYSGFSDTTLSLELVDRHLFAFDEALEAAPDDAREDDWQWVFRFTRKFWHETLEVTMLASTFGLDGAHGSFQRLQAAYDITDRLSGTLGLMLYQSGNRVNFRDLGDNDRIFFSLSYGF